jgi:pilus assembly protein Flp/PilA
MTAEDRASRCSNCFNIVDIEGATTVKNLFNRFVKDESGATAIEYGLIASLIGVAIIVGAGLLGTSLNNTFSTLSSKMR